MRQEPTQEIQVVNVAYDTSHHLTKIIYHDREAVVATELGRFLGYTNNGSRLVQMITIGRWAERFREGVDYEMLQGQDLQDFLEALSHGERVRSPISHLMILYTSGIHLVLLNTSKPIGTQLHRWLVDDVFPSLKATGSYHLPQKALPAVALFEHDIRVALSKIRNARIANDKEDVQPRDFAIEWDTTHRAHTAPSLGGAGLAARQIKALARQRGIKGNKSARQLLYEMEDLRHANISESAEIDWSVLVLTVPAPERLRLLKGNRILRRWLQQG